MAVTLTGSGGLFKRLGRIWGGMADVMAIQGGTATARVLSGALWTTRGTNIEADAAEATAISQYIDGHWTAIASWQSAQGGLFSQMKTIAEKIVIEQVNLDTTLPSKTLSVAIKELIRQMESSSDSVNGSTVSIGSQTDVSSPTGNPKIVMTAKNTKGVTLQMIFAEVIRFEVRDDSYNTATARQEPVDIRGANAYLTTDYRWPGGSGLSTSINLVDAQLNNSGGNKLHNSDFETFTTTDYPDNWVILTGTVTTNIAAAGSGYTQSNAVKLIGDGGGTLSKIHQPFNTTASTSAGAGGTPATLKPNTRYAVNLFTKVSSVPAAGVLRVALTDSSNTILNDAAGTANSFTIDLTGETTSYAAHNGVFITPSVMPTGYRLQIGLTTAIDSGKSVHIDDVALAEMTELYTGGPAVAIFAGATKVVKGDKWTVTITNTMGEVAKWMERFFGMRALGLQLPKHDSAGETVPDSVVA